MELIFSTIHRHWDIIWPAVGVACLVAWLIVSYHVMHRVLGHKMYRGTYYADWQYDTIMQGLKDDQDTGRRVLSRYEVEKIRKYFFNLKGDMIAPRNSVGLFD